jgi:hypothetical protein
MDVAAIPIAVNFPDFIRQAIARSKILIAMIGAQWLTNIHDVDDPVRMEIEVALASHIPVLPVLIANTPMPDVEQLPASISTIAFQNAVTVGVLHDFDTHMQLILPKIESILAALAATSVAHSDPYLIATACDGIIHYLMDKASNSNLGYNYIASEWTIIDANSFMPTGQNSVTLFLHRVAQLAELVELHFILSFWSRDPNSAHIAHVSAGWVMYELERTPIIPDEFFFSPNAMTKEWILKIRRSDEDARQVWKMITDEPLRLSLSYVATVTLRRPE